MRTVDADDLLDRVWRGRVGSRELVMKLIREAPTIFEKDDPKRNEWYLDSNDDYLWAYCGECEFPISVEDAERFNYCPMCGSLNREPTAKVTATIKDVDGTEHAVAEYEVSVPRRCGKSPWWVTAAISMEGGEYENQ